MQLGGLTLLWYMYIWLMTITYIVPQPLYQLQSWAVKQLSPHLHPYWPPTADHPTPTDITFSIKTYIVPICIYSMITLCTHKNVLLITWWSDVCWAYSLSYKWKNIVTFLFLADNTCFTAISFCKHLYDISWAFGSTISCLNTCEPYPLLLRCAWASHAGSTYS